MTGKAQAQEKEFTKGLLFCYNWAMLQKQRVFGITNSVMNYLFLVFILLAGMFFVSYWFELESGFLDYLVKVVNVFGWIMSVLSVTMVVLALVIAFTDKTFKGLTLLWTIVRMVVCVAVSVIIDVSDIVVSGNLVISL